MNNTLILTTTLSWPHWLEDAALRGRLEQEILPGYVQAARWYRSKTQTVSRVAIEAWTRLPPEAMENGSVLTALRIDHVETERYALPLYLAAAPPPSSSATICRVRAGEHDLWLCDACYEERFRLGLLAAMQAGSDLKFGSGSLRGHPAASWNPQLTALEPVTSHMLGAEQSNTGLAFSSGSFLKLYRRWEEGVHPEPEVLRFLEECTRFRVAPAFQSCLEWELPGKPSTMVALLQRFVAAEENGWEYALRSLSDPASTPSEFSEWVRALGRRTAELHAALGSRNDVPDFAPEALTTEYVADCSSRGLALWEKVCAQLAARLNAISDPADAATARTILDRSDRIQIGFTPKSDAVRGRKIRIHGDLHLGQVLCARDGIWFLDFEGETARPLAEKRRKQSPWRDVAGMLRSFHYALHAAARAAGAVPANGALEIRHRILGDAFLQAYAAASAEFGVAEEEADHAALLRLFTLEKAVYELAYELDNRPTWIGIPLQGLLALTSD